MLVSTILPVPYAFSKIGIMVGAMTMLLVAAVNDATCCMLIR
jgi:amino acid permease